MADPKVAENAAEKGAEAPKGPKMIMGLPLLTFILIAVNVLLMAGSFGYIYYATMIYKKPSITDEQVVAEVTKAERKKSVNTGEDFIPVDYEEMQITLRSEAGGKIHYATVEVTLVCGSSDCEAQVRDNKTKIQDMIQTALSSRSYAELSSLEIKFRVKHEILDKVNTLLSATAAVDLLFRNFLIQ